MNDNAIKTLIHEMVGKSEFHTEISYLFVFSRFCDLVLSAPSTGNQQPVLAKLQLTFAFLRETVRALYSPSEFLKAARPPW